MYCLHLHCNECMVYCCSLTDIFIHPLCLYSDNSGYSVSYIANCIMYNNCNRLTLIFLLSLTYFSSLFSEFVIYLMHKYHQSFNFQAEGKSCMLLSVHLLLSAHVMCSSTQQYLWMYTSCYSTQHYSMQYKVV